MPPGPDNYKGENTGEETSGGERWMDGWMAMGDRSTS